MLRFDLLLAKVLSSLNDEIFELDLTVLILTDFILG
jgi:hypothetical protein